MQLLLIIGAIISFSILALSTNQGLLNQQVSIFNTEAQIVGAGYAQQLIEEIASRSFDENTTNQQTVTDPFELTATSEFGSEGAELYPDDVDDYHDRSYNFDSKRIKGFEVNIAISYADTLNPRQNSSAKTYLKRIMVVVINPKFLQDSLTFQQLVSYH